MVREGAQERFGDALKELQTFSITLAGKTTDVWAHPPDGECSRTPRPRTDKTDKSPRILPDSWDIEDVLGEIGRPKSGAGINFRLYCAGEITRENAVEWITCAILHRRGKSFKGWRRHAPAVEAVLTHPLDCACEECL